MKEEFNKTDQLAQIPEAELNDGAMPIAITRDKAGKLLSMDRHSVQETQKYFTLGEAVEYFKHTETDVLEAGDDDIAAEEGQSVRIAS